MSFSFTLRARTVAAALALAAVEMDRVVQTQPAHAADRNTVLDAVERQVGLFGTVAADKHVVLNVNGSLSTTGVPGADDFTILSANVGVNVSLIAADSDATWHPPLREAPEA